MGKSEWSVRDGFPEVKTFDLGSEMSVKINEAKIGEGAFEEEATHGHKVLKWKEKYWLLSYWGKTKK